MAFISHNIDNNDRYGSDESGDCDGVDIVDNVGDAVENGNLSNLIFGKYMKTIGLLGGMSWESTLAYYRNLNEAVKQSMGGWHSAKILLSSVDFAVIKKMQDIGDWEGSAELLCKEAKKLQVAGADCILLCSNTMHVVAPQLENVLSIPLLHIADATAQVLLENKLHCVGLLGTKFTMEQDFYKNRLQEKFGMEVLVPEQDERDSAHDIIYQELCLGKILPESKEKYLQLIQNLAQRGAQAVILGCTEIGLLVQQTDTTILLIDTTAIHTQAAVQFALEK